jgi:hypothetical protein
MEKIRPAKTEDSQADCPQEEQQLNNPSQAVDDI